MGAPIYRDALIAFEGLVIQNAVTSSAINHGADALDATTAGDRTHVMCPGLLTSGISVGGFWKSAPDAAFHGSLEQISLITIGPRNIEGGIAYSMRCSIGEYTGPQGSVGGFWEFSLSGGAADDLNRGLLLAIGEKLVTDDGAAFQAGAVPVDETGHIHIHVTQTQPGSTLYIESDADAGFASPTVRATQDLANTGGFIHEVAGPVTDAFWRARWDLGGTAAFIVFFSNK